MLPDRNRILSLNRCFHREGKNKTEKSNSGTCHIFKDKDLNQINFSRVLKQGMHIHNFIHEFS